MYSTDRNPGTWPQTNCKGDLETHLQMCTLGGNGIGEHTTISATTVTLTTNCPTLLSTCGTPSGKGNNCTLRSSWLHMPSVEFVSDGRWY